jgi:hypothetical protein
MKILIGTPIHEIKDYCMERWIENVSKLHYPADLLLIDNSPGLGYIEKIKSYLKKYRIKNFKIKHFEINEQNLDASQARSQKVEIAQEMIRREALKSKYDAWFSWECDQIIPPDTLDRLVSLMQKGNYMMVVVNSWARTIPGEFNANMGVTLISQKALNLGWFLPTKNKKNSFDIADIYKQSLKTEFSSELSNSVYSVDEMRFKKQILKNGGNYVELYGVIDPIYHLDEH